MDNLIEQFCDSGRLKISDNGCVLRSTAREDKRVKPSMFFATKNVYVHLLKISNDINL